MTAAERLQAEKEEVIKRAGFYIPPYRLANLMKAAGRITDILVRADTNMCYEECRIILAIVASTIGIISGEDENE